MPAISTAGISITRKSNHCIREQDVAKQVLKGVGIILGGLVGLVVVSIIVLTAITDDQLKRTYAVPPSGIIVPNDAASVARGKHLVDDVLLCKECHGPNLSGQMMSDDIITGKIASANLTAGEGGVGRKFTSDEDWVRAIRHGVHPDGRSLILMASNLYYELGDADLAAVIAYLKTLPPVDHVLPEPAPGPLGRAFLLLEPSVLPASVIPHTAPHPPVPTPGVSAAYGRYIALSCRNCHGNELAGTPGESGGSNLTPGGDLGRWNQTDFFRAIREGVTPDGTHLDNEKMPWKTLQNLTDDEIAAIWSYVKSLPARTDVGPTRTRTR